MVHTTNFHTGPKRVVQRRKSIVEEGVTDSQQTLTFFTISEKKTLVRLIIDLSVVQKTASTSWRCAFMIMRAAQAVPVGAPRITEDLDEVQPVDIIWEHVFVMGANTSVHEIFVDLKSMRKFQPGDTIAFKSVSNVNIGGDLQGIVTAFFKLA